jgi:hypothetical protein
MSATSEATKGFGQAAMPYVVLGVAACVLWLYRDQIFNALKNSTGGWIETGAGLQPGTVTGEGNPVTDAGCRAKYGNDWIGDPWRGDCVNGWTGEHRTWQ